MASCSGVQALLPPDIMAFRRSKMLGLGGAGAADCAAQNCAAQEAARRTVAKGRFLRLGEPMKDVTTLFLRLFGPVFVYLEAELLFCGSLL